MRVDPSDAAALGSWHAAFSEGLAADREFPVNWTLPEIAVTLRNSGHVSRHEAYAAVDGGRVVGGALMTLPLLDNLTLLECEVGVPPVERRRGVGSALCEQVVTRARAQGRTSLLTQVAEPLAATGSTEGARFAARRGFTCRNQDLHSVLELPLDPATLRRLSRQAAQRHREYQLRTWSGACPDELAGSYAELLSRFIAEVPLGELDYEPHRWDVARLRAEERKQVCQARISYVTAAVTPDGALAGHTVLVVPGHDPAKVFQHDTLVLPEHRGHRLGLGLKTANLRAVAIAHPERRVAHTWNAEQNGPMLAVNHAMGFRAVELLRAHQRRVLPRLIPRAAAAIGGPEVADCGRKRRHTSACLDVARLRSRLP